MIAAAGNDAGSDILSQAQSSNFVMGAVIITLVVGILGRSFFGRWREFADSRRRIARDKDDADIAEAKRTNDYLRGRTDAQREEIEMRDRLAYEHQYWDRDILNGRPISEVGPPPPLFPARPMVIPTPPPPRAPQDNA